MAAGENPRQPSGGGAQRAPTPSATSPPHSPHPAQGHPPQHPQAAPAPHQQPRQPSQSAPASAPPPPNAQKPRAQYVAYNNPAQPANPSALPNGPPSSQEGVTPDNGDQGLRGIAKSGQQLFGRMSEQVNSFADTVGERLNLREKESAASIAATGFQNDGYGHNDSHVPSLQPQPQPQPNAEPATFTPNAPSPGAPPPPVTSGRAPPPPRNAAQQQQQQQQKQQQHEAVYPPNHSADGHALQPPQPQPQLQPQPHQPMPQFQQQPSTQQQPQAPFQQQQQQQQQRQSSFMTSQQQPIDKYKEIVAGSTKDMDPGEFPRPETSEMVLPELGSANAHPDFLRPTVSRLPSSAAAKDAFGVPLGVVVQPLAQSEVPLVDFDQVDHIPRCRKCRAYINPWFKWADHGRRFVCNMCGHSQDVDNKYMSSLIDHGSNARPELTYGSVEFEAGDDYMVRAPMPPSYIFVIDVSRAAVHSGTVQDVVENVRNAIEDIHSSPGGERAKVGFMAFDSVLYAFSMRSSLKSPSMMEVPDLERAADMLPPDVLVNLDEQRGQVEAVLDIITDEFSASAEKDSAFGPAVRAALSVLGQAQGGKMMMFQSTRPSIGPGKLNRRVDSKLNGTDREHLLRVPSDPFYKKLASECAKAQVAVDLFTFGVDGEGLDLPSLSALPKYTGGSHYYYQGYPGGTASREKFECDLSHNINRTTGWEAVVRIRVGPGFKIRNFEGNYFMRSTDLIAMPSPHSDHAFGIELMHREQSPASMGVQVTFIQTALLYTTSGGARRIRIHNLRLPLARNVSELYNSVDAEALAALTARQAAGRCLTQKLSEVRKTVLGRMCEGLRQFRSHVRSAARSPSKLLFPDTMQLVPLYTMCILKTVAMQGTATDVDPDERAVSIFELLQMPVNEALTYLCPKLFPLHLLPEDAGSVLKETGDTVMPPPMPLNGQYISTEGAYLADDARELLLWVGTGLNAGVAEELFGVNEYEGAIAGHEVQLKLRQDTDLGARVCRIVARLQAQQTRHKPLVLMIRSQMANQKLARVLKEDTAGDFSVRIGDYANFLSTVHAHVQVQPKASSNGGISATQ